MHTLLRWTGSVQATPEGLLRQRHSIGGGVVRSAVLGSVPKPSPALRAATHPCRNRFADSLRLCVDGKIHPQIVEHLPRQRDEAGAIVLPFTVRVEPESPRVLVGGRVPSRQDVEDLGAGPQ